VGGQFKHNDLVKLGILLAAAYFMLIVATLTITSIPEAAPPLTQSTPVPEPVPEPLQPVPPPPVAPGQPAELPALPASPQPLPPVVSPRRPGGEPVAEPPVVVVPAEPAAPSVAKPAPVPILEPPPAEPAPEPRRAEAAPASPRIAPPATERQEFLDRQLSFLRAGHLAYRPPSPIREGDWRRVVVRVSGPSAPPNFEKDLPGSGPVRNRNVSVGSDLIADLTGTDFNIVRVGGDDGKRTLETGTFAEWQWDVHPLRSGQRNLSLILYVRLQDGGPPLDVKTFVENIEVQVNPIYIALQWAKDYGPPTGLTVPVIVAAVWAVVHRKRDATAPAAASNAPVDSVPNRKKQSRKKRSTRPRS
jgi:hypothetical protein